MEWVDGLSPVDLATEGTATSASATTPPMSHTGRRMEAASQLRIGQNDTIICIMTQTMASLDLRVRARFFHGLADPSRLAILDALREGERTAGDVAAVAGLPPSNTSRHLACLKDCGLIEARQEWRHVYYRLAPGVAELLAANDAFIDQVAEQIAACERPEMGEGQ